MCTHTHYSVMQFSVGHSIKITIAITAMDNSFILYKDKDYELSSVDKECQGKDSFITQDRNEHFEGGTHEATFSRGHSSLTWGTIFKNWVPNERYGYYLSTDTLWVVAGQMVWSQQPCNVSHFSENFKIAEKFAFLWPQKPWFLHTFFQNALI